MLSESFVKRYKNKQPLWGTLGYITYKRTYARMTDDGTTEEWWQTIQRCCNGILTIGGQFTEGELETLYDYVFNLKCCFSGRALWQLGTKSVDRFGADSLQNCWHVAVNHPVDPFCFTFNQLMLGGGVGFNIMPEYAYELPKVKYGVRVERVDSNDCDFIVPDNREGWIKLLSKVLKSYFYTGKNFKYSTSYIRHKGRPIATFGGIASGPEGLVEGIGKIINILNARVNHKLRPIDCLDILNIIADIVVSGNVRRSAELGLGSYSDSLFMAAKDWSRQIIPKWRGMSNNSVACSDTNDLPESFWETYKGHGEPYGLVNLDLCRTTGRLDEEVDDSKVTGINPCGEIPMESYEACNLGEIFLPNIHSMEEFFTASQLIYKVCKTISCFPFSDPKVNEVVTRNHRLGIGITGVLQNNWLSRAEDLDKVYVNLQDLDASYSRRLGVNKSIKLTTVKPSGTLSLLAGCTPGIHPAYSPYYIRRIRFASNDLLVERCLKNGYRVEPLQNSDGTVNLDTMIVSFPVAVPFDTITAGQLDVIDQIQFQEYVQSFWSDNAVSITCYYRPEELPQIKEYLAKKYTKSIKSISFLLHTDHGYTQAPYEKITEEEYYEYNNAVIPITSGVTSEGSMESVECEGGSCPVK